LLAASGMAMVMLNKPKVAAGDAKPAAAAAASSSAPASH
jgi:hypothetical protein